ncbi:hypothetical protein MQE36_07995 [Zhouia spongiae]|uniref:Uncharacterized protein n=1 Tax=Zhouia spongiae TaxID=2202721 RepID=A0ABY3YRA6_9FLAO|nr:hypothetical protein [Zhouia spongiae]UNZ00269.1 hypothetical protein MQE36_07995 [Zhouia spongiae]
MKKLTLLFILFWSGVQAQDFSKLYLNKLESMLGNHIDSMDPEVTNQFIKTMGEHYKDSLTSKAIQKEAIHADKLDQVLRFFDHDITSIDSFVLIEEKTINQDDIFSIDATRKGLIIHNKEVSGFNYSDLFNPISIQKTNYLEKSGDRIQDKAREVIIALAYENKEPVLLELIKVENQLLNGHLKGTKPKKEFEVIFFNKSDQEQIRMYRLHETFVHALNQNE